MSKRRPTGEAPKGKAGVEPGSFVILQNRGVSPIMVPKTKWCPKCEREISINEFHARGRYRMGYCKVHQREYVNNRKARVREDLRVFLDSLKRGKPCTDCGGVFEPFAMDFNHKDPSLKRFNIAEGVSGAYSKEEIQREIEKCELVCAVCHRYITHGKRYGAGRVGYPGLSDKQSAPSSSLGGTTD